jgi:hypothetical protein
MCDPEQGVTYNLHVGWQESWWGEPIVLASKLRWSVWCWQLGLRCNERGAWEGREAEAGVRCMRVKRWCVVWQTAWSFWSICRILVGFGTTLLLDNSGFGLDSSSSTVAGRLGTRWAGAEVAGSWAKGITWLKVVNFTHPVRHKSSTSADSGGSETQIWESANTILTSLKISFGPLLTFLQEGGFKVNH